MMIVKLIILVALAASPALASAGVKGYSQQREEVKGYSQQREETKGGRLLAPVEQQRLAEPTKSLEQHPQQQQLEHREEQLQIAEQKQEEYSQQRLEEARHEETKGALRYEARPQIREEQRELPTKGLKAPQKEEQLPLTQQKEERFEQQQREYDAPQQQVVEIRQQPYEQRRYEEAAPLVQPAQPLAIVEETRDYREQTQQKLEYGTKGSAAPISAPPGQAEPYAFNYQVEGSSRSETGDANGAVRGQYTIQGADGSQRIVEYVADHNGFRASVNTNEFGTESKSPAGVALRTSQPTAEDITLRLEGKTRESVAASLPVAPAAVKAPAVPAKPDNWQVKGTSQLLLQTPQEAPQLPIQQLQVAAYPEAAPAPTKGQAPAPTKRAEEPIKSAAPASKGQKSEETHLELSQELHQAPLKSAELKAPKKEQHAELKQAAPAEPRSLGFESATAHRVYRQPQPATYIRPVAASRAQPVRAAAPIVNRGYLQRDRYPPSPVQGYRREHHQELRPVVAGNPRVSFYSPPAAAPAIYDDEHLGGFDQPE